MAEYIALQWLGAKKVMGKGIWPINLLRWHKICTPGEIRAKVTVKGVAEGIHTITGEDVKYYKKVTAGRISKAMKKGRLVIMEQKDPIHTIVLIPDDGDCYMASHGKIKKVSVKGIAKTATSNKKYRGMIVVRR